MTGATTAKTYEPRYIRLDANDNVAIVVNDLGLPARTRFPCGLELREFVPQGHKVALVDIAAGAPIRRYNEVIGTRGADILAGRMGGRGADSRCRRRRSSTSSKSQPPSRPAAAAGGIHVRGFPQSRRLGRHQERAGDQHQRAMRRRHAGVSRSSASRPSCCRNIPNVDDVVGLTHTYGCGVAIKAPRRDRADPHPAKPRAATRISAARSWSSASAARSCVPERLLPGQAPTAASCACRTRPSTASAPSSTPSWRWRRRGWPCSTGAAAKPVRLPTSWSACNAAALTPFPA